MASGIAKWLFRHICQAACPWNIKFSPELLAMSQSEFSSTFKGSPMKHAKLRGLKRNSAVVLGNAREPSALLALTAALSDEEPFVREHVAWALAPIGSEAAAGLED